MDERNSWTGWTNQELQAYDAAHVSVGKDGDKSVLILTAERKGNKIYSGRINSKGKKSFKYRKIEASIKLPKTNGGLWPAFWMMGDNDKEWPACGGDRHYGNGRTERNGCGWFGKQVNTAIHYGPSAAAHEQQYYKANVANSLQDGNYHTYSLDWDENNLTISIDNVKFIRSTLARTHTSTITSTSCSTSPWEVRLQELPILINWRAWKTVRKWRCTSTGWKYFRNLKYTCYEYEKM